jgi:RNase H-fold protein (predicted Holliday junction resolvase)
MAEHFQQRAVALIGIDPGRHIGVAWLDGSGEVLALRVVEAAELQTLEFPAGVVVALGDGTGSAAVRRLLAARGVELALVDERGSSEEARLLYLERHPPLGWRRWIPRGLLAAPKDIDAYAAWVIARRWRTMTQAA